MKLAQERADNQKLTITYRDLFIFQQQFYSQ